MLSNTLKYRWWIFWILALGYILVYFHRQCTAVLALDMMRDLNTDGTIIGLFGALYFYPYAFMQVPAGLLSDSWGSRKTITIFFAVAVLGSFLLGLSQSVPVALAGRLLVGIGVAMLFVPTMKILSGWFRKTEFATMMGLLMTMGGIGSLSATAPLAWLSETFGWRNSFFIIGVFTLLLALAVWIIVQNHPRDKNWPSLPENSEESLSETMPLLKGLKIILCNRGFIFLAIWFFFTLAIFFSFGGLWGGPFLTHTYGLSQSQAGNILSMLSFGMIGGGPLVSFLSNRILKSRKKILLISSAVNVLLLGSFSFSTGELSITALYLHCLGLGIFSSSVVVIGFTSTKELFPLSIAGTASGLMNLFPFASGALFQQILGLILENSGKIEEKYVLSGYQKSFSVLLGCAILALFASFFIRETFEKSVRQKN